MLSRRPEPTRSEQRRKRKQSMWDFFGEYILDPILAWFAVLYLLPVGLKLLVEHLFGR